MAYDDNVAALAKKRGIAYPLLLESDMSIAGLKFWTPDGPVVIMGTDKNRGSRLFFMEQAELVPRITESVPGTLIIDGAFEEAAILYFAQYWNDRPGTGTHAVLDAIRAATTVDLYWND